MKQEGYRVIFDMDGTLYKFDRGKGQTFTSSQFFRDLQSITYEFLIVKQGVCRKQAIRKSERIKEKYDVDTAVEGADGLSKLR